MPKFRLMATTAVGLIAIALASQAQAQSADGRDAEITALKRQLALIEKKLDSLTQQTAAASKAAAKADAKADAKIVVAKANASMPTKSASLSDAVVTMPGNRPTFCTADGFNCLSLTGRLQLDAGSYNYRPNTAATTPAGLHDGVNARRARLGVLGTFQRDWDFGLIFDLGGTQDNTGTINTASIAYRGFRQFKNLTIEGGYMDVPYTLDEATSSNNIMFLERSTANVLATSIAGGDARLAFGAHANDSWWWLGSYVTGDTAGATHSNRNQLGMTARGVVVPINNNAGSFIIGADYEHLFSTLGNTPLTNALTLSDRIELRVDPTAGPLNTGAIANVNSARVISGEAAASIGSFYAQGEYFNYQINRDSGGTLNFNGYYGQASYVLTGETRTYSASCGCYGTITPKNPVWSGGSGFGAWEIAARYTHADLNDLDVLGGVQKSTTLGVNWYVNANMRFMFNWINGKVEKRNGIGTDTGAHYDAFAVRSQVAF